MVLGVDFYKLCEDNSQTPAKKYINYKCNKCNTETKLPIRIAKHFKYIYEIAGNQNLPQFECTNCDGHFIPIDPMDF